MENNFHPLTIDFFREILYYLGNMAGMGKRLGGNQMNRDMEHSPSGMKHNQLGMEQKTREKIKHIWKEHGLGEVETIEMLESGNHRSVNRNVSCFYVNNNFLLRIQLEQSETLSFQNEAGACQILKPSGIPLPDILLVDTSKEVIPESYIISTRLHGQTIADNWASLSGTQKQSLTYLAGKQLALIHSYTLPKFAPLSVYLDQAALPDSGFPNWYRYVQHLFKLQARRALNLNLIERNTIGRMKRVLDRLRPNLEAVSTPTLLHGDYHFGNILQIDGRISGIINWEYAIAGDSAFDFVKIEQVPESCADSLNQFYHGYQSIRPLDRQHREKLDFYRLLEYLGSISQSHQQNRQEQVNKTKERLAFLLSELEWRLYRYN